MGKRYRLYFDESGDHTFHTVDDPAKRYLGLTGVIVETDTYRIAFQPALEALKQRHFPHSPDEPTVLHRKELVNRSGPFGRLRDPGVEAAFNADLLNFLEDQQYVVITMVIDKRSHVERYGQAAFHPYHYCLAAMLERYCGFLNFYNAQGDVMGESRGGQEDRQLKEAYHAVFVAGTLQRGAAFFQNALTSGEIKLKPKTANIAGLQVADLLAFPSKQEVLLERNLLPDPGDVFGREIARHIAGKYNRRTTQNQVSGYGKVFLA